MRARIRDLIVRIPYLLSLRKALIDRNQQKELKQWKASGRPMPPPHLIKQHVLKTYAIKYNLRAFVETGTYYGDMVYAVKDLFDSVFSVEVSPTLYRMAKKRFRSAKHVKIVQGDSARELGRIIAEINSPILFWLDGHYSAGITAKSTKETPIWEELEHILNSKNKQYVIVIDDARCFGVCPDYPTVKEVERLVHSKRNDLEIFVQDDSIRIIPKGTRE